MSCSICTPMPSIPTPPGNITICATCNEGVIRLITLANKLENDESSSNNNTTATVVSSSKGLENALKWVEELNGKLTFLGGFVTCFRDQIHTDILVEPGIHNNGATPIPAHRALLAARSDIFKNMLESDGCNTITLPELNYEEVESLLEFLYSGSLPNEKIEKHVRSLSNAAKKYNIPFLQKFCKDRMLESLISSLDNLKFIARNLDDVSFSTILDVQITIANQNLDRNQKRAKGRDRDQTRSKSKSRSPSPSASASPPLRVKWRSPLAWSSQSRSRSKSLSRSPSRSRSRSRSPSPSRSRSRSLSRSPSPSRSRSPLKSLSPSRSLSRSPSPSPSRSISRSPSPSRSRSRSLSRSPSPWQSRSRSLSPSKSRSRSPSPSKFGEKKKKKEARLKSKGIGKSRKM